MEPAGTSKTWREALVLPLDVADAPAIEKAAQKIEKEFGPIDVWVNNAMASVFSPIKEMTRMNSNASRK